MSGLRKSAARMGRPVSADGAKSAVLIVRVSADEKSAIESAAERADVSTSEWVRAALIDAASRT